MERQPAVNPRRDHLERYLFARDIIETIETGSTETRLLDAACGTGYGTAVLAGEYPVLGIDIEPEAIREARKSFPECEFRLGDISDHCWNGHFRAVVAFEILEHLINPDVALLNFRASAPILICSVPNENVFPFDPKKFELNHYPHQRHYTPVEFTYLLETCGYKVIQEHRQEGKQSPVEKGTEGRTLVYVAI